LQNRVRNAGTGKFRQQESKWYLSNSELTPT
jgi:hypothetical protein